MHRMSELFRRRMRFHVAVDEEVVEAAEEEHGTTEPDGDVAQFAFHQLFILAHLHTEISEDTAPDGGAEQGEEGIFEEIHADDAGGNADQMPDHGEKAGDENPHG